MSFVTNLIKQRIRPNTFLDTLRPEDVYSKDNFNAIKYSAFYFIESLDEDGALEFSNKLEKILISLAPQGQEQQTIVSILTYWYLRLKVFCFRILSQKEQNELFKIYIVDIFAYQLNLRQAIFKTIDIFSSGDIIKSVTKNYLSALVGSVAVLGSNSGAFSQANFKPIVESWLKEYQTVLRTLESNVRFQPGAFNIVKFMDSNQYVKLLSKLEKETLRDLLDLYNWLSSPITYEDAKTPEFESKYTNSQKFQLPKDILRPGAQNVEPTRIPPVVPAPKNMPSMRPMSDVAAGAPKKEVLDFSDNNRGEVEEDPNIKYQVSKEDRENESVAEAPKVAPRALPPVRPIQQVQGLRPVNIQDILNKRDGGAGGGLKNFPKAGSGQSLSQNNYGALENKPAPQASPNLKAKQEDIDKKLQELEKRIGNRE